ncbi:MAG TPA: hypothetical protein VGM92_00695 [Candidatus Kapabacteria bacterium]|jgi:hypothetical protein
MVEETLFSGYQSLLLSTSEAELVVTTSIGPRILCYRLRDGENILGLHPEASQKNQLGVWKPYGGHRLWAAPEEIPRTYYPDNDRVEYEILDEHSVRLRAQVERVTKIQKEMRVTLRGSNVTIEHFIQNCGEKPLELAPWSLTILRSGGKVIIPQEPFRSHDEYLLAARPLVLWHFTDLSDPRFHFGKTLIELECNEQFSEPTKIGAMNKQCWAGYYSNKLLFIKEFDYRPGANYPDYGSNCEAYTQAGFVELESLGPMELLQPGETAKHRETWKLREIDLPISEKARSEAIGTMLENAN